MAFVKEPKHDPRDMNAHEQDELIVYHLKRIQVLLLLIALATLFSAGFAARGGGNLALPEGFFSHSETQSAPVAESPAAESEE